jgi:hypothetical protein
MNVVAPALQLTRKYMPIQLRKYTNCRLYCRNSRHELLFGFVRQAKTIADKDLMLKLLASASIFSNAMLAAEYFS